MLVYCGNFKIEAECSQLQSTRLVLGISDQRFCWTLEPGEAFHTPEVLLSFTDSGLGSLSRCYQNFLAENICRGTYRDSPRQVLINNWEATYFDFTGEKICSIAQQAKDLGVEMLVLDDGWFGSRDYDTISTVENLMVPKRLAKNPMIADPLACFGTVSGMVFPILMFPACILYGLAELLIPEMARCAAAGSKNRIAYLMRRGLKITLLYGLAFSGLMYLLADTLCLRFYGSAAAGRYLRLYAPLIPMLYCDAITDTMTKGLEQQKACVRYNILTSAMDVTFLYYLLPKYGMEGYFVSFLVTHLVNFILSLRRLLRITGERLPAHIPLLALSAARAALWGAARLAAVSARCVVFLILLFCLFTLFQVCKKEDFM